MLKIQRRLGSNVNLGLPISNTNTFGLNDDFINKLLNENLNRELGNFVYTDSLVYSFNPTNSINKIDYNLFFYVPLSDQKYIDYVSILFPTSTIILENYGNTFVYEFRNISEVTISPSPIIGDKIFEAPEIPNQFVDNSLILFEYFDTDDITKQKLVYSFPMFLSNLNNFEDFHYFTYGYAKFDPLGGGFGGNFSFTTLELNDIKKPVLSSDPINNKLGYNIIIPTFYNGNNLYLRISFFNSRTGRLTPFKTSRNIVLDNNNYKLQFIKIDLDKINRTYNMFRLTNAGTYTQITNKIDLFI